VDAVAVLSDKYLIYWQVLLGDFIQTKNYRLKNLIEVNFW